MDKIERAAYNKKLIKFYRSHGHSAKESRQLAGEAMRLMAQGKEWQDKAQRKADKLQNYMDKAIVETFNGVDVLTLPAKNTRRTYKNNGCRVSAKAKNVSNALFMDVAQGKGRSKAVYRGQDSDNIAITVKVSADSVRQARHSRAVALVSARRNVKRQLIKAMLYRMRTTPESGATVWQVTAQVSMDYDADMSNGVKARNAAYNAALRCNVPYRHAEYLNVVAGIELPEQEYSLGWNVNDMLDHL